MTTTHNFFVSNIKFYVYTISTLVDYELQQQDINSAPGEQQLVKIQTDASTLPLQQTCSNHVASLLG